MCWKYKSAEWKIAATFLFKKERKRENKKDDLSNYSEIALLKADYKVCVFQLI